MNTQQQIQQRWAELDGAGAHVMQARGGDVAKAISAAMDAFAAELSAQYGVNVKELHWTRNQGADQSR